jgi:hypothetical protein
VRPSYVLGGRAMQIIRDEEACRLPARHATELVPRHQGAYPNDKTGQINTLLGTNPLLFDSYLTNAIEVDVDACATAPTSCLRHHGAHRGSRHPFRRQRLLAAAHTLARTCSTELKRQTESWPWRSMSAA